MHVPSATPFENLHWTSQDIADAVPLRLHEIDLFDAATHGDVSAANAARQRLRIAHGYRAVEPLPARFGIR